MQTDGRSTAVIPTTAVLLTPSQRPLRFRARRRTPLQHLLLKRLLPQLAALGVGNIVFVGAEKVEKSFWGAQLLKESVYRPLLVEGLMQCGTTRVPTIRTERSFKEYVKHAIEVDTIGFEKFVAHPGVMGKNPDCPSSALGYVLAIGPEGGWTVSSGHPGSSL